jgi:hypothetical protein
MGCKSFLLITIAFLFSMSFIVGFAVPNDPLYNLEWYLKTMKMEKAWDITQGDSNILISNLDSGIYYNQEDLKENMFADCNGGCPEGKGYDFVQTIGTNTCPDGEDCLTSDNDPIDCSNKDKCIGHGTMVASTMIATMNNNRGFVGICPRCKLLPLRVKTHYVRADGVVRTGITPRALVDAINYAVSNGVRIIVITTALPGEYFDTAFVKSVINAALYKNLIIINGAGNENSDLSLKTDYPLTKIRGIITVAGTDQNDHKNIDTNYGNDVDIAAPAEDIVVSSFYSDEYKIESGTSFAAPLVAGVAGLMLSRNPSLNSYQVESILKGATDFVTTEADKPIGTGRINAYQALLDTQLPCNPACASNQYCSSGTCLPKNNKCVSSNCDCADIIRDGIVDIKDLKKFLDDFRSDCRNIQPIYLLHQINRLNDLETVRNCNIFNNYCAFLDINYDGILKPLDVLTLINSIDSCPDRFSSPNMNTNSDVNDDKYVNYKDKDILVASLFKYPVGSECK